MSVRGEDVVLALSNGSELTVDTIIEAVRVDPEVGWLRDSELMIDDGVLVGDRLRTQNVEGVYAAGDPARIDGFPRVEHWGTPWHRALTPPRRSLGRGRWAHHE